jgi:hypothetical protein
MLEIKTICPLILIVQLRVGALMSDFAVAGLILLALAAVMNAGSASDSLGCKPGDRGFIQIC